MTTAIVKADPFTATLATLKADWPATFRLEVEGHVFRNVAGMDKAFEIRDAMERMKHTAVEMGYLVEIWHDNSPAQRADRWLYDFRLRPGFSRPTPAPKPVRVAALPPGPKELDEFLDGEGKA